jgi:hypothetical protein
MKNSTIALLSGAIPAIACLLLAASQSAFATASPVANCPSTDTAAPASKTASVPADRKAALERK